MRQLKRWIAVTGAATASAAMFVAGAGPAAADGADVAKFVPLTSRLRTCDFVESKFLPSSTIGTANATIRRTGSTVSAEVHTSGVIPGIWYGVRLVQTPRPGISCGAGDPGVAMGRLYTDAGGIGTTTVEGPLMAGATGAWVSLEGPVDENSSTYAADFRTSDFLAKI